MFFCCGVSKEFKMFINIPMFRSLPFFEKKKHPSTNPSSTRNTTWVWSQSPEKLHKQNHFSAAKKILEKVIGDGSCIFFAKKGQVEQVFQPINA